MFQRIQTPESIHKGGSPSKNIQWEEANHASLISKKKKGASTSTSNPNKGCAGNRKRNDAIHLSDAPTGAKKTCLLHGPRHSSEECKVLKEYTEKRSMQNPHKEKEAHPRGNNSRDKTVKFNGATQEVNTMKSHYESIPNNKKGKTRRNVFRVIRPIQTDQKTNTFMALSA